MFPGKLILQSLIIVPKNLQLYTAATVNSSKLSSLARANLNVPCVENDKNGTKKLYNNTGVGRVNKINAKFCSFSIPLEVYKKVRKVNHSSQITKIIQQRTKTNILHSKPQNFYQDTRKPLLVRNGNGIFKHRLQVSENIIRFITNRHGILPPPSANSKNINIPVNMDDIPSFKINVNLHGTISIPPPTSRNGKLINDRSKDLPESTFNIRMSKGRKVRPPSGTEKRFMSFSRMIKGNCVKKFNDSCLLKNRASLLKTLKCFIHTTQPLTDVQKTNSLGNLNKQQKEIYYKQHFPAQPFNCSLYTTNDDRIDEKRINELKKNRHFIKSYLRPINLPPPTSKKIKMPTIDSSLIPMYSYKQKRKSPLLDLIVQTKRAVKNVQLANNTLPLNINFPMSGGIQKDFDSGADPKNTMYVKMQGHDLRNNSYNRESQNYMMDNQMTNENQKSHLLSFNSNYNNEKTNSESNNTTVNNDYTVDMENKNSTEKSFNNYNTSSDSSSMSLKTTPNVSYKNNTEDLETSDTNNMFTSSDESNSSNYLSNSEENQENKLNTQDLRIFDYSETTWPKSDSLPESSSNNTTNIQTMNKNIYHGDDHGDENQENKDNFQTSSNMSTERSDNIVHKMGENQENKFYFQAFDISNSSKTSDNVDRLDKNKVFHQATTEISDSSVPKMHENQEIKVNFQSSNMNNTSTDFGYNSVPKTDENQEIKVNFQSYNMNNTLPNDFSDSSVPKIDENQESKTNFHSSNMTNTLSSETSDKINENQENKAHFLASNMNTSSPESSDSNVYKINEQQENKVNFETFGVNNSMSAAAVNKNNTESTYNNMSNIKETPHSDYFKTSNFINSHLPESFNNNLSSYGKGETLENKRNMQTSSGINTIQTMNNNAPKIEEYPVVNEVNMQAASGINTMQTMNNNSPKIEEYPVVNEVNMQAASGSYNTMQTMNNNIPKVEENQVGNQYFNNANNIDMNSYNNEANMKNENMISSNMHTGMTNESRNEAPVNIHNITSNRFKKNKRFEKGLSFMKTTKSLSELAKSFNHASMLVPKQSLWKKFKFPAPSPSTYDQVQNDTKFKSVQNQNNIPIFNNFTEARNYFVQPENLKKLTPSQVAMYKSILHYENVIKEHSEQMKRQKDNLESTQQALKHKHTFYKNKSNFGE